jgi:hypothetical protein
MFIHSYSKNNDHFLFLSPNQTEYTNIYDFDKKLKYGYLHYVFHPEESIAIISYVFISNRLRGIGLSKKLMEKFFILMEDELENHNLEYIDIFLDDVSERYGKKDNLYKNFGFQYIEIDQQEQSGGHEQSEGQEQSERQEQSEGHEQSGGHEQSEGRDPQQEGHPISPEMKKRIYKKSK